MKVPKNAKIPENAGDEDRPIVSNVLNASQFSIPRPSWAVRCAAFVLRVFGRGAGPLAVWEHELACELAPYRASLRPGGISANPDIVALGGVSHGPDAEILTLGVSSGERGQGIGAALLDELLTIAWEGKAEQVFLEVRTGDSGAAARRRRVRRRAAPAGSERSGPAGPARRRQGRPPRRGRMRWSCARAF